MEILKIQFQIQLFNLSTSPVECGLKSIKIRAHYADFYRKMILIQKLSPHTTLFHVFE